MVNYQPRVVDSLLQRKLQTIGAVLIEGPKLCGKSTTATMQAKSVLFMEPGRTLQIAALNPKLLFFDEPTSALDPELTREILKVIRTLAEEKMTMAVVTHEMHFARAISDWAIFMDGGVIVEEGEPERLFLSPQAERTKKFIMSFDE